jgi:hypothetical protein
MSEAAPSLTSKRDYGRSCTLVERYKRPGAFGLPASLCIERGGQATLSYHSDVTLDLGEVYPEDGAVPLSHITLYSLAYLYLSEEHAHANAYLVLCPDTTNCSRRASGTRWGEVLAAGPCALPEHVVSLSQGTGFLVYLVVCAVADPLGCRSYLYL